MKLKFIFLLVFTSSALHAQELVKTDYEQGYVKDGKKYSVWQYFNSKKEPELVIDHSTGRVTFVSKDTTYYAIFENGGWITSKLDIRPIPIEGTYNFYQTIHSRIQYPQSDLIKNKMGKVIASFEVDTLGAVTNAKILRGINSWCDSAVLQTLTEPIQWIPAKKNGKKYSSRFSIGFEFIANPNAARLSQTFNFASTIRGTKFFGWIPIIPTDAVYSFVEKPAEFQGGSKKLQEYIDRKLTYPWEAADIGMSGAVLISFIIEKDGSVTNVSISPPISPEYNQHQKKIATRVYDEITRGTVKMPKWKPAQQGGENVRSNYLIRLTLRLNR